MKKKMKSMLMCAGCATHLVVADVYYNNKTFTMSERNDEVVHIGHANATDGGAPDDALVTVKSGAVWTNTQNVILGATAKGKSRLTVESGAAVDFASLTFPAVKDLQGNIGVFELQEDAKAVISNITVVYALKSLVGNSGVVRLAKGSSISGICSFSTGSTNCVTRIELDGGSLEFDSSSRAADVSLYIGNDYRGGYAGGVLSGWGTVGFSNPNLIMNYPDNDSVQRDQRYKTNNYYGQFRLYGQVIADGSGVERDLDFSHGGLPVTRSTANGCGTNGWYAVNKGRLLMPRFPKRWGNNSQCIGGYAYATGENGSDLVNSNKEDLDLVNSFRYYFDDTTRGTSGTYVFSELYAIDRDDIPKGLPSGTRYHPSSIWRIGHFNLDNSNHNIRNSKLKTDHKATFNTVKLKFHYDPRLAQIEDVDIIRVYRCTDEKNGGWLCVGEAIPSTNPPYITTQELEPSSDLYNFGWFAIVGVDEVGTIISVR